MNTNIVIEDFQGPLDLLLTLISQEKIDILDIPIAEITSQYNEIINTWSEFDLEEVSEYITMAARLLRIKAQMLLPRPPRGLEYEDPRMELTNQLLEYKRIKEISEFLFECDEKNMRRVSKDPEYFSLELKKTSVEFTPVELERAMRRLLERERRSEAPPGEISKERYTVSGQINYIRNRLKSSEYESFRNLQISGEIEELVANFLAFLELYKLGEIDFYIKGSEIFILYDGGENERAV